MAELIPIQAPLANPNDTVAMLVEWRVANHVSVTAGQIVARMETTKAVIDVDSPATGRLECLAEVGAEVSVGAVIGFVEVPAGATSDPVHPPVIPYERPDTEREEALASEDSPDRRVVAHGGHLGNSGTNIRLTRRAQLAARRIGVDPTMLGLVGLVRTRELLEAVERGPIPAEMTDEQVTEQVGGEVTSGLGADVAARTVQDGSPSDGAVASLIISGIPKCHQCSAATGTSLLVTVQPDGYVRIMCLSCFLRQQE